MTASKSITTTDSLRTQDVNDAQQLDGVKYRFAQVGDVNVFYREAGDPNKPTILLLHGFAGSSFMCKPSSV